MDLSFTLDDLLKKSNETLQARMEESLALCKEAKAKMLTCKDEAELDKQLATYIYYSERQQKDFEEMYRPGRQERITHSYNLFSSMAYELSRELKATVTGDEIRFKWQGESISFIVQLLAGKYNLHSKGFTFNSSFTTHEAYTEKEHLIHIGIDREDPNCETVLIQFHLLAK